VVELLEEKYGIGKDGGDAGERPDRNSWFGHKDRGGRVELTVEGEKRAMGNGE